MPRARVLAVDDQRYFRELLDGVLSDEGYEVVTASTGEEALHILDREDFDVIVTDLVMPGMDGAELVRRVKERSPAQDIVMVTGVADVNAAVGAMKQGATDYILKPFDRQLLTSSLDGILRRRRLADEHARLMAENLEYMGVLSLYERAAALFSTLSLEPLAERFVEGLCLETRAQGGVLWAAGEPGGDRLLLVAARGIIRIDEEPRELSVSRLGPAFARLVDGHEPMLIVGEGGDAARERPLDDEAASETPRAALYVPLRHAGQLVGIARLSDKLEGDEFADADRMIAERFTRYGSIAVANALHFRALERRSLRDPTTGAYTHAYFEDVVRNEIQKANRFGRPLSLVRLELGDLEAMRRAAGHEAAQIWCEAVVHHVGRVLRSTDLLCAVDDNRYSLLLAETDAVGTAGLVRRIRAALEKGGVLDLVEGKYEPSVTIAGATYPTDGTQLEALTWTLDDRSAEQRSGPLRRLDPAGRSLADDVAKLLEQAEPVPHRLPGEVVDFLIEEAARRPREPGLLFVAPGRELLSVVRRKLNQMGDVATRTEIVVAAKGESPPLLGSGVTWIPVDGLGTDRPCILYCGERPAYALLSGEPNARGDATVFHTSDRSLVEHLAFQVRRDLGILPEGHEGAGVVGEGAA